MLVKAEPLMQRLFLLLLIATIASVSVACGGARSQPTESTAGAATGTATGAIVIDGSSTVAPLATITAESFEKMNPGTSVTVGTSGTGGGFEKFCSGETDIATASRAIEEDEIAACEDNGVAWVEVLVANDGIALVVNSDNDWASCMTVEQLNAIWGPNATAGRWSDIDPSWPATPLKLFGPGTDSGTFDFFTKAINGEEGASRTDYSPAEDDNVTIQGVTGETGGLGYFGLSYYEQNRDALKLAAVDAGEGCVTPETDTVQGGTYTPLSRQLYMYVASKPNRPEIKAFMEYLVANDTALNEQALFVPLSPPQVLEAERAVEGIAA